MKCQGDETHKALSAILQFPQPDQVVDAILDGLDVSVQHCSVGGNASGVDFFGQLQPPVTTCFVCANPAAGRLSEYLGSAARAAIESSGDQPFDDLLVGHPADCSQVVQFDHREGFQVHIGEAAF